MRKTVKNGKQQNKGSSVGDMDELSVFFLTVGY